MHTFFLFFLLYKRKETTDRQGQIKRQRDRQTDKYDIPPKLWDSDREIDREMTSHVIIISYFMPWGIFRGKFGLFSPDKAGADMADLPASLTVKFPVSPGNPCRLPPFKWPHNENNYLCDRSISSSSSFFVFVFVFVFVAFSPLPPPPPPPPEFELLIV